MLTRKVYSWIASLALHCLLLAVPLAMLSRAEPSTEGIVLDFDLQYAAASGSTDRQTVKALTPTPRVQPPSANRQSSHAAPEAAGSTVREVDLPTEAKLPAKNDVSVSEAPNEAFPTQDDGTFGGTGSAGMSAQIGWESASRSVVQRGTMHFPQILSARGQETDCEARITVTPLGMVSKVEIIRSSGYTEIDASVETALRGYVFTRDYGLGKKNAIGIVKFRFRLERLD
jgi:outer membrane biosynthesis protein TonB